MHSSWDITLSDVKGISLPYDKELIVTKGANQKNRPHSLESWSSGNEKALHGRTS